jgi:hypothetical protein
MKETTITGPLGETSKSQLLIVGKAIFLVSLYMIAIMFIFPTRLYPHQKTEVELILYNILSSSDQGN